MDSLPITEKHSGHPGHAGGGCGRSDADSGHSCGCSDVDSGLPELDARAIPHAIRHAAVFGALDAVKPGEAMVLVAPHDPKPLLAQIADREGGAIEVTYIERGPEAWRLRLSRR